MLTKAQRILWVADEAAVADVGQAVLARLGYEVVGITRVDEAVATVQAAPQRFAVLITDYRMPGLTGIEFAAACRQRRADLPIILCTGECPAVYAPQAAAQGIDAVLLKPFRPVELTPTLQQVLSPQHTSRIL